MRVVRVNELLKRELSLLLHTRYRDSSVYITLSEVETSPDLKTAVVYYGVIGAFPEEKAARQFFARHGGELRIELGKRVILKYLPHLTFQYDDSMERGARIVDLLDSLDVPEHPAKDEEK
jgi:ribosome-binding factor A